MAENREIKWIAESIDSFATLTLLSYNGTKLDPNEIILKYESFGKLFKKNYKASLALLIFYPSIDPLLSNRKINSPLQLERET